MLVSRPFMKNPFEISNIQSALDSLGRNDVLLASRTYSYFRFDPSSVSGDLLTQIEGNDESHFILDFPFADGNLYSEENQDIGSESINDLKDGFLYIVINNGSPLISIFENQTEGLVSTKLFELYRPLDEDIELQAQALINSGHVNETSVQAFIVNRITNAICPRIHPNGRVTYKDQFNNAVVGVPQIKVWTVRFGIPIYTFTNNDGYFTVPALFNIGTYIGTHAKNFRATIKPINSTGGFTQRAAQITSNFIAGSVHLHRWIGRCNMDNISIHFENHDQPRLWAQLLNAIKLHHDYANVDGILAAPNLLTIYAHWDEVGGAASAPMLGHISLYPVSLFANLGMSLFDFNLSVNLPSLFNLMTGLMPDVTVKVSSTQHFRHSEKLMEVSFHEFAHASLFRKVGQTFWIGVISNIVHNRLNNSPCGSVYGCPNGPFAGLTQVNEAWAEFLGKLHHSRHHPNGSAYVRLENGISGWYPYPQALEQVPWFIANWINTGIFYDLMDPSTVNEIHDNLQGFSVLSMYNCFKPTTNGFCDWRNEFLIQNPSVLTSTLNLLMAQQNEWNGQCYGGWVQPIF
jgi:hypothetical protein